MRVGLRIAGVLVAALALAGGYQLWNRRLRDEVYPRRFAEVRAGALYRSGQIAPRLVKEVLAEHSIDTVVALLHYDERREEHRAERAAARALGVDTVWLHLRGDGTGELESYVEALTAISDAEGRGDAVLVHCSAGVQRTGAVLALYKLLVEEESPEAAYAEIVRFGDRHLEESGLVPFLNARIEAIAVALVLRGVLERVPRPVPQLPVT